MSLYRVFVPKQAVGASLVYFDLFVPTTAQSRFSLLSCVPMVSGEVAVVGTLAVDLFLTRTSAVGTGGTAATFSGTSLTAMTISGHDNSQSLTTNEITGRLTPTGGATASAVLSWCSVFTEETADATYARAPDLAGVGNLVIRPGTGIRVIQGGVASAGNIGFNLILSVDAKY